MERKKKLLIAQVIPSPDETPIVGDAKKAIQNAGQWDQIGRGGVNGESDDNDPKPERVIDPLDQLNQSDQQARAGFLAQGLDGSVVDSTVQAFMAKGMKQSDARQFMNELVSISNSSSTSVSQIIPVALGLYNRFNNVNMTKNVLEDIGQYAAKIPEMGLWGIALKASQGQPVTANLSQIAMALWQANGYQGNLTQYNGVLSDIISLFDPSSNLGQIMNNFNKERNRRRMNEEGVKLDFAQSQAEWWAAAEKNMGDQMEKLNRSLPGFLHSPAFSAIMRLMTGIVTVSKAWQVRSDIGQWKPASAPTPTGWGSHASASAAARNVLAQMPPPGPSPTLTPGPNTSAQGLPQNVQTTDNSTNNANQGQANPAYNQQAQHGGQMNTQFVAMQQFVTYDQKLTQTYDSMWQMLNSMISGGDQGSGDSGKTPYLTPDQIQGASVQLSQIAAQGLDNAKAAMDNASHLFPGSNSYQNEANQPLDQRQVMQGGPNGQYVDQLYNTQHWQQIYSAWQMKRVQAMDIGVIGPIVQQIESLKPYVEYYQSQIELSNATMNGVGSNVYVMPLVQYCNQIAGLFMQAAQHYAQISQQGAGNPSLAQFANRQRERYMMEAAKYRNMGISAISKLSGMLGNKGNDTALMTAHAGAENQLVRLAEELNKLGDLQDDEPDVVADNGEGDYYDELYKGTDVPNYGDALENPAKYRRVLTPNIGHKKKFRKKIRLDL